MRDIIEIVSHTDKQITPALLRVGLNCLLSAKAKGASAISIFSIAAILITAPAQANIPEESPQLPEQNIGKKSVSVTAPEEYPSTELPPANQGNPVSDNPASLSPAIAATPSNLEAQQSLKLLATDEVNQIPAPLVPKSPLPENLDTSIQYHLPEKFSVNTTSNPAPQELVSHAPVTETMPNWLANKLADKLTPATPSIPAPNAIKTIPDNPQQTTVEVKNNLTPSFALPTSHSSFLAQSLEEKQPDASLIPENSPKKHDALTPTLDVQGVYLNQGDDAARLRLRGIYPVSPHALFGAIVDLASGTDFQGTEGSGVSLSELYFTGSLPNYSNLRLTAGLMDLTSYFDRNSFAKDSTTHFFHPLFQTNPALASAGIGSRPGALLNWNITDNIEAKAAVFSSERNLGDFSLNAFAGEIGFRAGTGIFRATYATDKDKGRGGVFGTREGDRENAFGLNGEFYIPQIKMGLFARYGWLENTDRDSDAETYSFGINFLDLFVKDARLGLGYAYGPDFSKNDDVWELFYDIRIAKGLRAGITLQERDGFSETIVGFRVKSDIQLYP
ncbi:MAG TPA: hypothetical protein DEG17_26440 [Cyanobacteria bacterium UBA11149]|nr:hypothetical protein [Cyanobacteria bacterium UBA11367]HBE59838.1 hypothetical protein [Cyanobacteria bacterium UBA11366]HBR76117.1 hypothetical protein [Cyanobacteria bacterium UBA11159]HBS70611.1 hypothetical protein [Cyanobacteria bacterium UBA11153]HBW92308.1 hypothetical protein [Cyanobacteria bacterium UBA11149]HCA97801.1 hypothetical protein [Cyanobacteria bacterium UBA9226]